MPNAPAPVRPVLGRRETGLRSIGEWLLSLDVSARNLDSRELAAYRNRRAVAGWRIELKIRDNTRRLDILADDGFPRTKLRLVLVDRPQFLTWPHVERDGALCLLPPAAEVSIERPVGVAKHLLFEAYELIDRAAAGEAEEDFRAEFLSYWSWGSTPGAPAMLSVLRPMPPTRPVRVWTGEGTCVLGESETDLWPWLENRYGRLKPAARKTEESLLLWLPRPLLPSEYPKSGADVLAWAKASSDYAFVQMQRLATERSGCSGLVVAIGAETENGSALASVTIRGLRKEALERGFRPGRVPEDLVKRRFFSGASVVRSVVERADPEWVHGRGQDPRLRTLRSASVVVLGCGSIGAPVAIALAQAGVGRIVLVDPESLKWANIGRHPLGARSVGKNKARELAVWIRENYPHVTVETHAKAWEAAVGEVPTLLWETTLVVSAIGHWAAEGALNEWHVRAGRPMPVVYAWTEAHACAGHAVAITGDGGCMQCGVSDTQGFLMKVTDWPQRTVRQEPACGAVYQPYGPIELMHSVNLAAELVLDCLLGSVTVSLHRIWVGRVERLQAAGGTWSGVWRDLVAERPEGGFLYERGWNDSAACIECAADVA